MRPVRRKPTDMIVVHCSATPPDRDIGAADIDSMHKDRGWQGIGYHLVIRRSGALEYGEPIQNRGAHAKGVNDHSVGVCLVGGIDSSGASEMNFTNDQLEALKTVLSFLSLSYPDAKVLGHRDLSPDLNGDGEVDRFEWRKDCPCIDVEKFISTGVAEFGGAPAVKETVVEESVPEEEPATEKAEAEISTSDDKPKGRSGRQRRD